MKPLLDLGFFVVMAMTMAFGLGMLVMLGIMVAVAGGVVFCLVNAWPLLRKIVGMSPAKPSECG